MRHIFILLTAAFSILTTAGCVLHSTGETEVGVRTRKTGFLAPKGVEDRVYAQGATYFFLPFINDWNVFDTKLQNLEMTFSKIRGDRRSQDDLVFKTIDGNDISLDVIIAYRIDAKQSALYSPVRGPRRRHFARYHCPDRRAEQTARYFRRTQDRGLLCGRGPRSDRNIGRQIIIRRAMRSATR
jgi:regulator of protease activity HflC (stomatin/prohibitin superfamily)